MILMLSGFLFYVQSTFALFALTASLHLVNVSIFEISIYLSLSLSLCLPVCLFFPSLTSSLPIFFSLSVELEQPPLVKTAANVFRHFCYRYRDQLMASIICAGWDKIEGGQVSDRLVGSSFHHVIASAQSTQHAITSRCTLTTSKQWYMYVGIVELNLSELQLTTCSGYLAFNQMNSK